jgi:hypothetical protein
MVDEGDGDIPPTSRTVFLDRSHLIFEYATSDNEEPALVQLPTQASACILCICKFEQCHLNCDYSHQEACIQNIQSQFMYTQRSTAKKT